MCFEKSWIAVDSGGVQNKLVLNVISLSKAFSLMLCNSSSTQVISHPEPFLTISTQAVKRSHLLLTALMKYSWPLDLLPWLSMFHSIRDDGGITYLLLTYKWTPSQSYQASQDWGIALAKGKRPAGQWADNQGWCHHPPCSINQWQIYECVSHWEDWCWMWEHIYELVTSTSTRMALWSMHRHLL